MNKRVVVTGLGVVSPNGTGLGEFKDAISSGKSGIRYDETLEKMKFTCRISGRPEYDESKLKEFLPGGLLAKLENRAMKHACLAGAEAWLDAGLEFIPNDQNPDWDSGMVFGAGSLAMGEFVPDKIRIVEESTPRKLGPRVVEQTMNSGAITYLNRIIGFGNLVLSNSNACSTGTEAAIIGYERIKAGKAKRMLCGSTESEGWLIWSAFDGLRILCGTSNDNPEQASRPMAADAAGIVPAAGAGAYVLEDLDSALERGARIYGEIVAGELTNGGLRNGGSITAANPDATQRAIKRALNEASITGDDIDLICGHLTSTVGDAREIASWKNALERTKENFPLINTLKAMTGHCLSASGSIEMVGALLQLHHQFVHPNINIETVHPEIVSLIGEDKIPKELLSKELNYIIKANLGFGDVNSCLIFKKWSA